MGGSTEGRTISAINVTPFVDVVLVLLVVLMVSAVQIVRSAIAVDLPRAAASGTSVSTTLNVIVQAGGQWLLDGQAIDETTLVEQVRRARAVDPQLQVVIAADKRVAYERVIRVVDLVKQQGVLHFALNVERARAAR